MGLLQFNIGELNSSLESLKSALELSEELQDNRNICEVYINIGRIYRRWGKFDTAGEYLNRAYSSAEKLGDEKLICQVLSVRGHQNNNIGHPDLAIDDFTKGLDIARSNNYKSLESRFINSLGLIFMQIRRYD